MSTTLFIHATTSTLLCALRTTSNALAASATIVAQICAASKATTASSAAARARLAARCVGRDGLRRRNFHDRAAFFGYFELCFCLQYWRLSSKFIIIFSSGSWKDGLELSRSLSLLLLSMLSMLMFSSSLSLSFLFWWSISSAFLALVCVFFRLKKRKKV